MGSRVACSSRSREDRGKQRPALRHRWPIGFCSTLWEARLNLNPVVGLWLIIGLVIGLFILRRTAVARRKKRLQQHIARRREPRPPRTTERADMRAYEDPSTFARDITTTGSSSDDGTTAGKKSRKKG